MTLVIARADRLGYAQVIATIDALKTAIAHEATDEQSRQQRCCMPRLRRTG